MRKWLFGLSLLLPLSPATAQVFIGLPPADKGPKQVYTGIDASVSRPVGQALDSTPTQPTADDSANPSGAGSGLASSGGSGIGRASGDGSGSGLGWSGPGATSAASGAQASSVAGEPATRTGF